MHPLLIAGAALVGLPVLLHLIMKQEPKRLLFPAFRFLKQRLKTNQRKLRLRHLLLLALRVLLIALFCAVLYQPRLHTDRGDSVAVVVILDTSPSMAYAVASPADPTRPVTRLQDACAQALTMVKALPEDSFVAVIETGGGAEWVTRDAAITRIQALHDGRARAVAEPNGPFGGSTPVTDALALAYPLFRHEKVNPEGITVPRYVAIFTDRAVPSWGVGRVEELKQARDALPGPKPIHLVVDVGVEHPANVGIVAARMEPRAGSAGPRPQAEPGTSTLRPGDPARVAVTVAASGRDAEVQVRATLDPGRPTATSLPPPGPVQVPTGERRTVAFDFGVLPAGFHQVQFKLDTPDALAADDTHYLTFLVQPPRGPGGAAVLVVADRPEDALLWAAAVRAKGEFTCDVITPAEVTAAKLAGYGTVCLLSVAAPGDTPPGADGPLWPKLKQYVDAGGNLVLIPAGGETAQEEAIAKQYAPAPDVFPYMPGTLKTVVESRKPGGARWLLDNATLSRAEDGTFLAPFRKWKQDASPQAFTEFLGTASRYWDVQPSSAPGASVLVEYDDGDGGPRRPAVLEREVPAGKHKVGRVLLLTTRMDFPQNWNGYWNGAWAVVFPHVVVRYLAGGKGGRDDFNYTTGGAVVVGLADILGGEPHPLFLIRPEDPRGVQALEATTKGARLEAGQVQLGPPLTLAPGNFVVRRDPREAPQAWWEAFSLNVPGDETLLEKVPAEVVEDLTGPGSIGQQVPKFPQPVPLAPWLLIAVLMLLVLEAFLANRFYRRPR